LVFPLATGFEFTVAAGRDRIVVRSAVEFSLLDEAFVDDLV
jgi:hypothetical protein